MYVYVLRFISSRHRMTSSCATHVCGTTKNGRFSRRRAKEYVPRRSRRLDTLQRTLATFLELENTENDAEIAPRLRALIGDVARTGETR